MIDSFFATRRWWMLAIFIGCLGLYWLTLTGVHTFDAYSYASAVHTKPWRELFHPHHLLYGPMGALVFNLGRGLGIQSPFLALQLLNVLAGAAGVSLWFAILDRFFQRRILALISALSLLLMYAWWYYAVEIEVYTLATFFLIIAFGLLLQLLSNPQWRNGWLWLGLAHSGAILFHQTNVLWVIVVLVAWLIADWKVTAWRERWRFLGLYSATGLIIVGGLYALVMLGSDLHSWTEMRTWLFEYAETGFWGGAVSSQTLVELARGWRYTLTSNGGGLILLASLGLFIALGRRMWQCWRRVISVVLMWIAVYTLFFAWWEADNIEFWIALLPAWIMLVLLALATLPQRWQRLALVAWTSIILLIGINNGIAISRRGDPANDTDRQIITQLAALGGTEDLYIVPNGLQELYLRYEFGRNNVIALSIDNGNWQQGCQSIQSAINTMSNAGYAVWIDQGVRDPAPELLQRYRLNHDAVQQCFAPFTNGSTRATALAQYYVLAPIAQGQPVWKWQNWSLGWRAFHIDAVQWDQGWSFIPQADPVLLSPLLNLNTKDWWAIRVVLATTLEQEHAQLYWMGPNENPSEAKSVSWKINPDGDPNTYTIELWNNPEWNGSIVQLRLDPVSNGNGDQRLKLISIELLPRTK